MSREHIHQELEVAQAGGGVQEGSRKSRVAGIFTTTFFSASVLLAVSAVTFAIVFVIYAVLGSSMMLTLNPNFITTLDARDPTQPNDIVLVNRFATPRRGDIIVVRYDWHLGSSNFGDDPGNFIKRVIGVPGDRIRFERERRTDAHGNPIPGEIIPNQFTPFKYTIIRNDHPVIENYRGFDPAHWGVMAFYGDNIYEYLEYGRTGNSYSLGVPGPFVRPHAAEVAPFHERTVVLNEDPESPSFGKWEIVVPEGEIFYMGDNRGSADVHDWSIHSFDGTAFGPQPISLVRGVRVATVEHGQSVPEFIWEQIKIFFSFRWI
jgi:signal peptidase I